MENRRIPSDLRWALPVYHSIMHRPLALLLSIGLSQLVTGTAMAATEEPKYDVILQQDAFELRQYAPTIVAEVTLPGERDAALNQGFRLLAGYIFGGNAPKERIAMTAPVTQSPAGAGETIAMTALVSAQAVAGEWRIRFTMPSQYAMSALPTPDNLQVKLREVPGKRFAVIRFSGFRTDGALQERSGELQAFIRSKGLVPIGEPIYAFYDPPWTLPFMRRNEVLWEVGASSPLQ